MGLAALPAPASCRRHGLPAGRAGVGRLRKATLAWVPCPGVLSSFLTAAAKVQPVGWRNFRELAAFAVGW